MIPQILHLGPFPINSFGLMMVCAFFGAWRRLSLSLEEAGEQSEIAERMVFWAALGGILGARLDYLLSFPTELFTRPLEVLFGGAGFVFYGGFIGGVVSVWILLRREQRPFLRYADISAPALAIGYAIGRIGCQLSGDGDYGRETDLPWAMSYSLGIVPTPPGVLVHPAPVYETFGALMIAWLLLTLSRRQGLSGAGQLFGLYLILSAVQRFLVEMIRIEPVVAAGLTQAQLVAVGIALFGAALVGRTLRS